MDLIFFCSIKLIPSPEVEFFFFLRTKKNYKINLTFIPSDRLNFYLSCFFIFFISRLTHPHPNHNLNSSYDLFPIMEKKNLGNKTLQWLSIIHYLRNQLEGFIDTGIYNARTFPQESRFIPF